MAAAPHSPGCNDERVHDAQEWKNEAQAVIKVSYVNNNFFIYVKFLFYINIDITLKIIFSCIFR